MKAIVRGIFASAAIVGPHGFDPVSKLRVARRQAGPLTLDNFKSAVLAVTDGVFRAVRCIMGGEANVR